MLVYINLLLPGECGFDFECVIFKCIVVIASMIIFHDGVIK